MQELMHACISCFAVVRDCLGAKMLATGHGYSSAAKAAEGRSWVLLRPHETKKIVWHTDVAEVRALPACARRGARYWGDLETLKRDGEVRVTRHAIQAPCNPRTARRRAALHPRG